ncbi:hypothetical protein PLESTB_000382600 [Pleodorina starrii]|uniref:SBP-type domain-containing protein n=1 Tax=Pleodorina starrii TaxID=330485 RepID=A0A9W6BEW8_9CHLO|nr:hypothetical protein PLESTB_000382600 [Pleodorina starrii]
MVAPGEATVSTDAALSAMRHVFLEAAPFQAAAENPSLASLPVLETVDRTDAEPATVCEVVGCGASLEGLKRYYVRMRVCERHLHAPAIVVNGVVSRFCQQCAKFQFVGEFSGSKKSCIATLERHNARHRAKVLARMQEQHDGDSDSAPPAGGRAKGRPRAAAAAGRRKAGQPLAAVAAAAAAVGCLATERTDSGTSGAGTPDGFGWAPQPQGQALHGFQQLTMDFGAGGGGVGGGGGVYAAAGQGLAAAPPPGVRSLSAGVPVLSAEATAPSKPASPHVPANVWDGASSSLLELPPRPLVTTGGNGVVSTGDRALTAPADGGGGAAAAELPAQHLPHAASMPSWQLQQQQQHQLLLPYDVRSGLEAVQGQLLSEAPGGNGMHAGSARQAAPMPPGAWHHHHHHHHPQLAPPGLPADATPRSQAAASGGSTPSASNGQGTSGTDTSEAKSSQATARQAMQAAAAAADRAYPGGGGLYGNEGLQQQQQQPEASKSGGSHQSDAEPCGSSGRVVATNAASPMLSQDEGVSATRVSASGGRMGSGGSAFVDASAPPPRAADDVAARISCIMQELCPLIEQFKKEVTQGSVMGQQESAFAAAAAAAAPPPLLLAVAGPTDTGGMARDHEGSSSLSPLMDNAVAMMQTASQLAASLQQSRSQTAPHAWTVTSGGPEPRLPTSGSAGPQQGSSDPGLMCANSNLPQTQPPQPQRAASLHPAGWRPLASHPGIVVNEAAAQQAASYAVVGGGGGVPAPAPGPAACPAAMPGMPFPSGPLSAPPPPPGGAGLALSAPPAAPVDQITGGYSGAALPAGTAAAVYPAAGGFGGGAVYAEGSGAGPSSGQAIKGDDSDDDMFQQLLTLLDNEAVCDDFSMQQQQQLLQQQQEQQLYLGIASTAQHAVGMHQQAVQALPYGHVPASPFYWPAQAQAQAQAAPPPAAAVPTLGNAHLYPSPAAPHHHHHQRHQHHQPPHHHQLQNQHQHYQQQQQQQPQHYQAQHLPVLSMPFGWPTQAPAVMHVEEPDEVDPRELTRVSLKAMNALPHELPSNLRSNLRRWLKEARAEALQSTLRPGCLHLVVDVLRPAAAAGAAAAEELSSVLIPAHDADQAAADVFRVLGQRLRDTYVQVDRRVLQMRIGERPVVLSWEEAAQDGGLDGAKYPSLSGCSAAAVCAGSEAVLQLSGCHLSHPSSKAYARLRGHDLRAELLPPLPAEAAQTSAGGSDGGSDGGRRLRMRVAVPPGSVGLMAVEVGVGHLLGDWWPVLVLPPGCEGAAAEVRRLQADAEATATGQGAGGQAASRAVRRLLFDLAKVLEVFDDAAAAAAAAAANAAAAAAAAATARARSSNGSISSDAPAPDAGASDAAPAGARSPPQTEGRCPSPSGGSSSNVSRSDASFTAVSAGGWSCAGRTDTLLSTNAGSTLGSFMTTSSALASPLGAMAAGQAHAQAQQAHHLAAAAVGDAAAAAAGAGGGAAAAAAAAPHAGPQIILLPPPPSSSMRQALSRAARLLRFTVARGLPHLTALLLAAAHCLARTLDGNRQSPSQPSQPPLTHQAQTQSQASGALPDRADQLAGAGIDLQALLPLAVLSGSADTVERLTAFAARVLGSPLRLDLPQGPGGLSVLHLAALLPDGGALACHIVATQSWAAWEWLSLGWTPPQPLVEAAAAAAASPGGHVANGSAVRVAAPGQAAQAANGNIEHLTEEEEEVDAVLRPAPPGPPRLTPGQLSVLLGGKSTVRRAVEVLLARRGDGGGASLRPGSGAAAGAPTAALVSAVEAWGRTGVALLEALCAQLAQQRL